jgi:hypothetical protein
VRLLLLPSPAARAVGAAAVQAAADAALAAWARAQQGSSRVPVAAQLLASPPDPALGEITVKGTLNQRVLRTTRRQEVDALYAQAVATSSASGLA